VTKYIVEATRELYHSQINKKIEEERVKKTPNPCTLWISAMEVSKRRRKRQRMWTPIGQSKSSTRVYSHRFVFSSQDIHRPFVHFRTGPCFIVFRRTLPGSLLFLSDRKKTITSTIIRATPCREGMSRLSLPLKITATAHHSNALVHNPFSKIEVLVDCGADIFGFNLLCLEGETGGPLNAR